MVDINNLYNFNDCVAPPTFGSGCQDIADYFPDIDESDLIHFNDSSPFLIDTPPETPVSYQNGKLSNENSISSPPYTENSNIQLDYNSNFNAGNSDIDAKKQGSQTLLISQTSPIAIGTNYHLQTGAVKVVCPSASQQLKNVIANTGLNGYHLDHSSILNHGSQISDCHSVTPNSIRPKSILPCKISNHKLKRPDEDELSLKKRKIEARKLRNREAALNSRLKKKEYVENLESCITALNKEKNDLIQENAVLRQKIATLEQELSKVRSLDLNAGFESSNKKAKISFFAVVFMLFLQVSPYLMSMSPTDIRSNTIVASKSLLKSGPSEAHLSRTLLWNANKLSPENYFAFQDGQPSYNASSRSKCGEYHNRTELMRLENELRGWLTRFKREENLSKTRTKHSRQSSKKLLYDLKHVPIPRLKLWMQKHRYFDHINDDDDLEHNLDHLFPSDFENLMSMVNRRDDTFYYLSYPSKGHLILPPMSNRTDIRPRFSFLIPTFYNFSGNGSVVANHNPNHNVTALSAIPAELSMLQIDCQVINTKVTLINANSKATTTGASLSPGSPPHHHHRIRKPKSANRNNKK